MTPPSPSGRSGGSPTSQLTVKKRAKAIVTKGFSDVTKSMIDVDDDELRMEIIVQLISFVSVLRKRYDPTYFSPVNPGQSLDSVSEVAETAPSITDAPVLPEAVAIHPAEETEELNPTPRNGRTKRAGRKRGLSERRDSVTTQDQTQEQDEEEQAVPRKRSRRNRPATPKENGTIQSTENTIALGPNHSTTDLASRRVAFYEEVKGLSVKIVKDQQEETVGFTPEDANEVTSLLIDEATGVQSLKRLTTFVDMYNRMRKEEPDVGAAARAEGLAAQRETPVMLRKFFGTFSHHQKTRANTPAMVQHVDQMLESIKLLNQYEAVRRLAENKDPDLIKFFKNKGLNVSKGRNWTTVTIDYIAEQLEIDRTLLVNTCQRARGVQELVNVFDEGILLLLPLNAMSRLRRLGNQRMLPVYQALKRHVPQLQPICDVLRSRWYLPYINGSKRLPNIGEFGSIKGSHSDTYLELLQEKEENVEDLA